MSIEEGNIRGEETDVPSADILRAIHRAAILSWRCSDHIETSPEDGNCKNMSHAMSYKLHDQLPFFTVHRYPQEETEFVDAQHCFNGLMYDGHRVIVDIQYLQFVDDGVKETVGTELPDFMVVLADTPDQLRDGLLAHGIPERYHWLWMSLLFPE